ncbi:unnamed protein product [Trypanosoma congolense IL3000]|uniref:WGS project CAEQ00000000 data, annotated contig 970 n=1 Tax=Trypanosoma congolense (strain IL3000) TaxID=1068625 RepID=F9WJZ2_TRYCI|nr:unnamed protein product [Trypanosoma congolense IL3000]
MTAIRANGEDYNKEEHGLLCNVLAAAVRKWGNNGEKVSCPLKQALQQTIFGMNENRGENPKTLTLPKEYESNGGINPNHDRHQWCGACNGRHYPGESSLNDLLCVCTLGPDGVPNETGDTLCGHNPDKLGVAQPKHMGFGPNAESEEDVCRNCSKLHEKRSS